MKPFWLVAAVLVAAFLVARRRRLDRVLLAGGALAAAAMAVYSAGVFELPDLDTLLEDLGRALGTWTYLLVGVLSFTEAAAFLGLLLPGETVVIVGGVVAGQGQIDIVALIAIVWAAAFAGDLTGYALGRRLGRPFLMRYGPRFGVTEERVKMVEAFFDRHGGKAVFIGRFVGVVRSMSPFLAGSSQMALRRFVPYDILGAGIQSTLLCLLGFVFWHSLDRVLAIVKQGAFALGTTIVLLVALVVAVRWLRVPANRERVRAWLAAREDRRAVRLLLGAGRRVRRPARFLYDRLTPGDLGLELTTLLAVAAVSSFVFFGYLIVLDADVLTPGDRRAASWAGDLRGALLDDVAAAVAHLGGLPVTASVLGVTALVLLLRRHALEGASLLAGFALAVVGVELAQTAVTRAGPLGTGTVSYPDAEAAYAVAWVAVAVALRHALAPLTPRAVLLGVAIALAAVVGLASVYEGDDWFSDVTGGFGLGLFCFSLTGTLALALGHARVRTRPLTTPRPPG